MTDDSKHKQRLLRVLDEAERRSSDLRLLAQDLVRSSNFSGSLAHSLHDVVVAAPDDSALPVGTWVELTDSWIAHNERTEAISKSLIAGSTVTATAQAAALTTTLSTRQFSAWIARADPDAVANLEALLHRPTLEEEVRRELKRLRLDVPRPASRSAADLVGEALSSLQQPAGSAPGPASVLIPARESIHLSIADLLQRRPVQEPAKKLADKVSSIGRQLGWHDLPVDHFDRLAQNAENLIDRLSGAKQKAFSATELSSEVDSVLQFHRTFLSSLDDTKVR